MQLRIYNYNFSSIHTYTPSILFIKLFVIESNYYIIIDFFSYNIGNRLSVQGENNDGWGRYSDDKNGSAVGFGSWTHSLVHILQQKHNGVYATNQQLH